MTKVFVALLLVIVIGSGFYFFTGQKTAPVLVNSYEYYWREGCPHCEKVSEFFDGWSGSNKIELEKKGLHESAKNSNLLVQRAQKCGMSKNDPLGVPFLYTPDGSCLMGDEPIIEYFKSLNI